MLYITSLDTYNVRFSDTNGITGTYKVLPKATLEARTDDLERIWVTHKYTGEVLLNSAPASLVNVGGNTYSDGVNVVIAINQLLNNGTLPTTTTTTEAPTTTTTTSA